MIYKYLIRVPNNVLSAEYNKQDACLYGGLQARGEKKTLLSTTVARVIKRKREVSRS